LHTPESIRVIENNNNSCIKMLEINNVPIKLDGNTRNLGLGKKDQEYEGVT
jgi:hypothetical protein